MEKTKTYCFAGHRRLPKDNIQRIMIRLNQEIDNLISQGVTDFISGGALGFDQIATSVITAKKEMGYDVKLVFALPCRNQDVLWTTERKKLYHGLLDEADEIVKQNDLECVITAFPRLLLTTPELFYISSSHITSQFFFKLPFYHALSLSFPPLYIND
ncbi:MAG: SLOG family protein [Anaerotignum propionicum]|uniref:SLOG family protein n=1 Tax=Anaerotignum propionicum TaxID=28446 RepID=UPI002B1FFB88|nr:SLOG family protein [Anaerotignum propionicum]MEA5056059.1 SLOG family protein [Anaerotignum propionicum]